MQNIVRRTLQETTGIMCGTTTDIPLVIAAHQRHHLIVDRVTIKWLSGTGTSFTPRIGSRASFTNDTVEQRFVGSTTETGYLFDETAIDGYCQTDTTGSLFLRPGPDAGSDNLFTYCIEMRIQQ